MNVSDAQRLLAAANYYKGAIDGDAGRGTMAAVAIIESNANIPAMPSWPTWRRLTAAGQLVLRALGYPVGTVDGLAGPQTAEALTRWNSDRFGTDWKVDRTPVVRPPQATTHPEQQKWPLQKDMTAFFGPAGGPRATRGSVTLPFPFRIAWDLDQKISRFACHDLVAAPMTRIFARAFEAFGKGGMQDMGLDLFGGCYANRPMRGGVATSTHAFGVAVDLDPTRNQLRWGADRAQFARPEYRPFWEIVMSEGATPAGYAWGQDWMHFQWARLK